MILKRDIKNTGDEELVKLAHAGNTEAEELLIQRYKGLALAKSRSYYLAGGDRDDLIQEGMIGLFQAIRDFDGSEGTSFATFANLCVSRQMISAIRAANRKKHSILNDSLSLESGGDDERGILEGSAASGTEDPAAVVAAAEIAELLERGGKELFSAFENQVLDLLREGRTSREIADILSRETKSVNNAVQRVKKKIRHMISG